MAQAQRHHGNRRTTAGSVLRAIVDFRNIALAFTVANVIALYGAALAYPVNRGLPPLPALKGLGLGASISPFVAEEPRFVAVSTASLQSALARAEYRLERVRSGQMPVPRLFLAAIPKDFPAIRDARTRKTLFLHASLPLILQVNEEILATRRHLLRLHDQVSAGRRLPEAERYWLAALARKYGARSGDFETLLRRVDTISPAIAIAQAALESGWGQSRFAMQGNALYGQRTWSRGAGIVPGERDDGKRFEVKNFDRLLDSVRDYALNLNRHAAYADLRAMRAEMRAADAPFDAHALATGLSTYSELGEEYVGLIQSIIRANKLENLETAQLAGEDITQLAER